MENLVIEGKNYISSKRAAELMGYTQDYIGQLARAGKISAERVSGVWYVSEDEFSNKSFGEMANKTNAQNSISEVSNKQSEIKKDKNNIILDGVDYISSKQAAEIMGYTQDYIGQLCRGGKIEARQVGRGWYIPKSVVHKRKEEPVKKESIKELGIEKNDVLSNVVVFNDEVAKTPSNLESKSEDFGNKIEIKKVKQVVEKPVKEEIITALKEEPRKEVVQKTAQESKEEYYYPSFLSATYSLDDSPLVPTPKRSREPVLHRIVSEEEKDTFDNKVTIRHDSAPIRVIPEEQATTQEPKKALSITREILNPRKIVGERKLAVRSPLSLIKIATVGVSVLLLASIMTFVPSISVFSSNTGTLNTVLSLTIPQNDALKAEVVAVTSKTSLMGGIISTFIGFFENEIDYKAK